jgi:antibiotic biosynthesis monooxygenase (ABM) superfamily enzyme
VLKKDRPKDEELPAAEVEGPVTVAVTRTVASGRREDAFDWFRAGQELARERSGFLGAGWLRSSREPDVWHVLYRFASPDELNEWEESVERRSWLKMAEPFIVEAARVRRTGVEGWFDDPLSEARDSGVLKPAVPLRWKQMVSIFLPFLPLSLMMAYLLAWLAPEWPLWLRSVVSVSVLTPLMTYFFLPWTTRLLRKWLQKP